MRRASILAVVLCLLGAPLGGCEPFLLLAERATSAQPAEPATPRWSELFDRAADSVLPLAQVVTEAVILDSPSQIPKKWTVSLAESGLVGGIGGRDGIVVLVLGGDPSAITPTRVFNKIVAKPAGGKRGVGRWQDDLGGAVACTTAASAKNIRVVVKGRQPQQLASGSVVAFVGARVSLTGLGFSDAEFVQFCKLAPDLIRQFLDNLVPDPARLR